MTSARCKNCGTTVLGRYCAHCGQAADVHVPTTAELAHEVLEGLTHSDSRLWRTLTALWLKPGGLTQEFVAGRRVAYLPPFRLYLVLSVLFFVIASVSHSDGEATPLNLSQGSPASRIARCDGINFESFGQHPDLNQRIQQACKSIMRDNGANLQHLALATLSKAMFIFLPLVAFLNMLLYWRPKYRYAEQLLFVVHLQAFFFSAAIVMLAATNAAYFWPKLRGVKRRCGDPARLDGVGLHGHCRAAGVCSVLDGRALQGARARLHLPHGIRSHRWRRVPLRAAAIVGRERCPRRSSAPPVRPPRPTTSSTWAKA